MSIFNSVSPNKFKKNYEKIHEKDKFWTLKNWTGYLLFKKNIVFLLLNNANKTFVFMIRTFSHTVHFCFECSCNQSLSFHTIMVNDLEALEGMPAPQAKIQILGTPELGYAIQLPGGPQCS